MSRRCARVAFAAANFSIIAMVVGLGVAAPERAFAQASPIAAASAPLATHKEEVLRQFVRERVEAELIEVLPDFRGDTPETRSAAHKVASAILVPGSDIKLEGGERVVLASGRGPRHRNLANWLRSCVTARGWRWRIEPVASRTDELPNGPVLRLVILTRMDFGSVLQVQRSKGNKSGVIESEDYKRVLAANQAAERAAPMYAEVLADAYAAVASDPGLGDKGTQVVALLVSRRFYDDSECAAVEQAAERYAQRVDADPWLAQYLLGHAAILHAWRDRGSAYASQTSAEQFAKFQQGLDRAYAHLLEAQRINSASPYAAAHLAIIARASHRAEHMTPEYWFERATVIDPTCFEAYHALAFACMPRWGGDLNDMVSFFRSVAKASTETNRLGYAMSGWLTTFSDDDPQALTNQPLVTAVFDSLRPMFNSDDAAMVSLSRSAALACAYNAKLPRLMAEALGDERWTYASPDVEYYKASWPEMLQYYDERQPAYGTLLSEARALALSADLDLAAKKANELLQQPDLPQRIRTELREIVAAKDAQVRYADGNEVPLVGPGVPFLLTSRSGKAMTHSPDAIVFGFSRPDVPQTDRVRFQSAIRLGHKVVITGRMRATLNGASRSEMFFGQLTLEACMSESPGTRGVAAAVNVARPKIDLATTPDPLVIEHAFRFVVNGAESTIEIDGERKKVMKFMIGPEKGWGEWLVVTGRTGHVDATLELLELKAQRLDTATDAPKAGE